MPITIRSSPEKTGINTDAIAESSKDLLRKYEQMKDSSDFAKRVPYEVPCKPILHSSSKNIDQGTAPKIIPYANGFIEGVIRAYQQDLHLVLRPDDVWQAEITQFSFYVTGHAEELRGRFVAHEGQKELEITAGSSPGNINVATMARKLTCLVEEHWIDGEIRHWIIPDFTTTTDNDIAVASMKMVATMQKYFAYNARRGCGFPSVTVLGDKCDWIKMRQRLGQLQNYGDQPASWVELLVPIFDRFVAVFERPDDGDCKTFWLIVCHAERGKSGEPHTFSGWITAFAFWQCSGLRNRSLNPNVGWIEPRKPQLSLDGLLYPIIEQKRVPCGIV